MTEVVLVRTQYLRELLDGIDLDCYTKFVDSVPACSNYLVETRVGCWGDRTSRVVRIRSHFHESVFTIREHLAFDGLTAGCKIGLSPRQDRRLLRILNAH